MGAVYSWSGEDCPSRAQRRRVPQPRKEYTVRVLAAGGGVRAATSRRLHPGHARHGSRAGCDPVARPALRPEDARSWGSRLPPLLQGHRGGDVAVATLRWRRGGDVAVATLRGRGVAVETLW